MQGHSPGNDGRAAADVRYRVRDADSGQVAAEGEVTVPANQNWLLGRLPANDAKQRLYLMSWQVGGATFGNHYLVGTPPFDLDRYVRWLPAIAGLERPFDPEAVAR